jgi:hypothetical protein
MIHARAEVGKSIRSVVENKTLVERSVDKLIIEVSVGNRLKHWDHFNAII